MRLAIGAFANDSCNVLNCGGDDNVLNLINSTDGFTGVDGSVFNWTPGITAWLPREPIEIPSPRAPIGGGPTAPHNMAPGSGGAPIAETPVDIAGGTAVALEYGPQLFRRLSALPLAEKLELAGRLGGGGAFALTVGIAGLNAYNDYHDHNYTGVAHEVINVVAAGALWKAPSPYVKGAAVVYFLVNDTVGWGPAASDLWNAPQNYEQLQGFQALQQAQQAEALQQLGNSRFPLPP